TALLFFFSSRRRHTSFSRDWSSDVCSSDLEIGSADDVRTLVTQVRERLASEPAVVALIGIAGGRPIVAVGTTERAREAGVQAGEIGRASGRGRGGGSGGVGAWEKNRAREGA